MSTQCNCEKQFSQIVLIQTIQFSLSTVSMSKTVLFQTIQFCISTQFSSIWPIDMTQSAATTPDQSGLGSDGNKRGTLHFPKLRHYWNLTIRLYSVIYRTLVGEVLPLGRDAVSVFNSPSRLGNYCIGVIWQIRNWLYFYFSSLHRILWLGLKVFYDYFIWYLFRITWWRRMNIILDWKEIFDTFWIFVKE